MKKSILTLALLAAPLAFAASTDATTMDQETVSTSDMHYDTNSNARFDNRDTRTNSQSTPASMGAEKSHLDPDVTSNQYVDPNAPASDERMTGSSTEDLNSNSSAATIDQNQMDSNTSNAYDSTYNSDETLSGSATESTAPAAEATGAATGAAMGAGATESTTTTDTTTTTTKKTKKAKKGHKGHHKSGSSSSTDSSNDSTVYPKSSSSDVTDSYNRSGSTTETPSSSSTPGSTASERSTGSSTMDSMSGSSRPAGSSTTGAAATGAAAGAAAGSKMNSDSSYHKDLTAQDTSAQKSETEMVRKIRSEITDNKDLSVNAHNIKIISQNNQIVLKGQVADANEKMKVEEIAKRFAGNTKVLNQTMIDSRSGSSTNK